MYCPPSGGLFDFLLCFSTFHLARAPMLALIILELSAVLSALAGNTVFCRVLAEIADR
jgi:hypothetical protein